MSLQRARSDRFASQMKDRARIALYSRHERSPAPVSLAFPFFFIYLLERGELSLNKDHRARLKEAAFY